MVIINLSIILTIRERGFTVNITNNATAKPFPIYSNIIKSDIPTVVAINDGVGIATRICHNTSYVYRIQTVNSGIHTQIHNGCLINHTKQPDVCAVNLCPIRICVG